MRNEEEKAKVELKVFEEFASSAGLNLKPESLRKGNPNIGEPDIVCMIGEDNRYFELAEVCAPEIAAAVTHLQKTDGTEYIRCQDVSIKTIQKKLKKTYKVNGPVDLVLYTADRTVLPDDVIASHVEPAFSSGLGPFRQIWLYGDKARVLASNS